MSGGAKYASKRSLDGAFERFSHEQGGEHFLLQSNSSENDNDILLTAESTPTGGGQHSLRQKGPFGGQILEIVVCEFREDGHRRLWNISLREFYEYVMRAITNRQETKRWELNLGMSVVAGNAPTGNNKAKFNRGRTLASRSLHPRSGREIENDQDDEDSESESIKVTHRERLGGYLHPRDMRRLVTPFSSSNAPALMVRRHAMLLNFDPLRAVILRDRVLAIVSRRSDTSLLYELEERLKGGRASLEENIFGSCLSPSSSSMEGFPEEAISWARDSDTLGKSKQGGGGEKGAKREQDVNAADGSDDGSEEGGSNATTVPCDLDELDEIDGGAWRETSFELQAVDAVLSTVTARLSDDANELREKIVALIAPLQNSATASTKALGTGSESEQESLKLTKDRVGEMEGRFNGFIQATSIILEDEKDMALMNVSRLLTHPERFMLPIPPEVLEEEASDPEMLLEGYHHQALSMMAALHLLKGQITSTEELLTIKMDLLRNKLLFLNTMLALAALFLALANFVSAIFGMNLSNGLEDDPDAWLLTVSVTFGGCILLTILSAHLLIRRGYLPRV